MIDKVSIVIPCFNSGSTLLQAVESAKCQTWPQLEVIVVDDGSTDIHTLNLLKELDDIILIRQANRGLAAARNTGFRASSSKYILLLDSDDWLEQTAVEELVSCLTSTQCSGFAFSYMQLEGEASGILPKSYNFFEQLFFNQIPYSILLPYSTWFLAGGYDESMCNGYEDWEFNIRLASLGFHGSVVPKALFHYRVRSSGMLLSHSNSLHRQLWTYIQKKHHTLYTPSRLLATWLEWRLLPSTYPLSLYFLWLALYRLLPSSYFSEFFRILRAFSHSKRLN